MTSSKLKVLFFAEGATLAHVARPFVLARELNPTRFEIGFARPASFSWLTAKAPFRVVDLHCQDAAVFGRRLERGQPLYDYGTLLRYVDDDLILIDAEQPDLIVGDFRLSLSVSARLRAVPYITICDAYWSPERPLRPPLPVLPFTRFTPLTVARSLFDFASGIAFRLHAKPMERLRKHFGLPSLGHDLRRCYTDADLRLFANFPALFPEITSGSESAFIGPVAWTPQQNPDQDLGFLESDEPLIYVTLGSSGDPRVLGTLLPALEQTKCLIVIASAGKVLPRALASPKIRVYDFLPGDLVCSRAQLVVCNGGSPTTNQALKSGVPVLGIASNMDQFLSMEAIERYGAGLTVRADRAGKIVIEAAVDRILQMESFRIRAQELADSVADLDSSSVFSYRAAALLGEREKKD